MGLLKSYGALIFSFKDIKSICDPYCNTSTGWNAGVLRLCHSIHLNCYSAPQPAIISCLLTVKQGKPGMKVWNIFEFKSVSRNIVCFFAPLASMLKFVYSFMFGRCKCFKNRTCALSCQEATKSLAHLAGCLGGFFSLQITTFCTLLGNQLNVNSLTCSFSVSII